MWISISTVCAASSQFQPSISMTDEVPEIWPLMGVVSATEITLNRKVGINSESVLYDIMDFTLGFISPRSSIWLMALIELTSCNAICEV